MARRETTPTTTVIWTCRIKGCGKDMEGFVVAVAQGATTEWRCEKDGNGVMNALQKILIAFARI
jgi:hypothetical protein